MLYISKMLISTGKTYMWVFVPGKWWYKQMILYGGLISTYSWSYIVGWFPHYQLKLYCWLISTDEVILLVDFNSWRDRRKWRDWKLPWTKLTRKPWGRSTPAECSTWSKEGTTLHSWRLTWQVNKWGWGVWSQVERSIPHDSKVT